MPIHPTDTVVEFLVEEPRLTNHKMPLIEDQLDHLAHQTGQRTLRLDFQRVEHLTSMVLGKLVSVHKRMKNAGGSLEIVNLNPELYDLFHITRLNTVLDVRARPAHEGEGALAAKSV